MEVLSYHNTSSEEEVKKCLTDNIPQEVADIDHYYFNPFAYDDFEKARFTIYMFKDLFGLQRFSSDSLAVNHPLVTAISASFTHISISLQRFTLTIKKNYRRVPYHNWTHGFSVANTMYTVIKNSEDAFRPIEVIAAIPPMRLRLKPT